MHALLCWGFTLRSRGLRAGVAEVVGKLAREHFQLQDSKGRALGPDRIEQVLEQWRAKQRWRARPWTYVVLQPRRASHGAGLIDRRPHWSPRGLLGRSANLEEFADELLRHGGRWPHGEPRYLGDDALTDKAWAAWLRAPRISPPGTDETG